jgi:hypothetical protein
VGKFGPALRRLLSGAISVAPNRLVVETTGETRRLVGCAVRCRATEHGRGHDRFHDVSVAAEVPRGNRVEWITA